MYAYAKDGITVASILDIRRSKRSGLFPVKIRVTYMRGRKYYPTGKETSIESWKKLPTNKSRAAMELKADIENSFNIIRDIVKSLASDASFSFEELNIRIGRGNSNSVNSAFIMRMEQMKADGHIGNTKMYSTVLKGIERFAGTNIRFDTITPDWLRKYDKFLLSEGKARTTISMHMRTFRAIINEAKHFGIIRENSYPFGKGRFEIQEGEGRKLALTLNQIGQIAAWENKNKTAIKYRDYWLFLYFCNGMNVADFVQLKYRNIIDDEIYFIRQKTKHTTRKQKEIRAVVIPQMQAIIEKWGNPPAPDNYVFPILTSKDTDPEDIFVKRNRFTVTFNKQMKKVGRSLGIGNISTYTARHSYATVLKRSGANIAYISESLGHHNMSTTETYLATFEKEERRKNATLLTKFQKK